MNARSENQPTKNRTSVERTSDREMTVTRTVNGPAHLVFEAWTTAELFGRWWVPKSAGLFLRSCEMDVRVGGTYRLVFGEDPAQTMAFFGTYREVVPHSRIVWTNDESGEFGALSTVTFTEKDGRTEVVFREVYPSKEALDASLGAYDGMGETFDQLEALLVTLGA